MAEIRVFSVICSIIGEKTFDLAAAPSADDGALQGRP